MEGVWFALACFAFLAPRARPHAFVVVAVWAFTYAAIIMGHGTRYAFGMSVMFDAWSLLAGVAVLRIWPARAWGVMAVAGFAVSIVMQAAMWGLDRWAGLWFGLEAFHAGRALFTVQLLAVCYPAAADLRRAIKCRSQGVTPRHFFR